MFFPSLNYPLSLFNLSFLYIFLYWLFALFLFFFLIRLLIVFFLLFIFLVILLWTNYLFFFLSFWICFGSCSLCILSFIFPTTRTIIFISLDFSFSLLSVSPLQNVFLPLAIFSVPYLLFAFCPLLKGFAYFILLLYFLSLYLTLPYFILNYLTLPYLTFSCFS